MIIRVTWSRRTLNKGDSYSDCEDCDDVEEVIKKYATMSRKHFTMQCERNNVSARAASKLGNALLRDLGLVNRGDTAKLIWPTKHSKKL